MSKHALLSASGASRWMACPSSARYELEFEEQESIYADEGTLAHAINTILIGHKAFNIPFGKEMKELQEHELYSEEMMGYCNDFADYVIDKVRNAPGQTMLFLERKLDMRTWIKGGFGTTDIGIVYEGWIEIIDYKHGKGVPVDAYENKQLMTYGLGAIHEFGMLYDIHTVRMTVYQPRIDNISSYDISVKDLMRWSYEVLKPAADLAWEGGNNTFMAGEHCRFCRAKALCPTNAKYNLQLAKIAFAPPVEKVSDEQVVKILAKAGEIKRWVTSVEDMALKMAIAGKKWPGMKLVQGRSTRKYADEAQIIDNLLKEGISESEIVNKKLTGIVNLSSKITKLQFQQLVEPHVIKPDGKPTLVSADDSRPEFNSNEKAKEVFDDV